MGVPGCVECERWQYGFRFITPAPGAVMLDPVCRFHYEAEPEPVFTVLCDECCQPAQWASNGELFGKCEFHEQLTREKQRLRP